MLKSLTVSAFVFLLASAENMPSFHWAEGSWLVDSAGSSCVMKTQWSFGRTIEISTFREQGHSIFTMTVAQPHWIRPTSPSGKRFGMKVSFKSADNGDETHVWTAQMTDRATVTIKGLDDVFAQALTTHDQMTLFAATGDAFDTDLDGTTGGLDAMDKCSSFVVGQTSDTFQTK